MRLFGIAALGALGFLYAGSAQALTISNLDQKAHAVTVTAGSDSKQVTIEGATERSGPFRSLRTGGVIINGSSTWRTDQLAYGGIKASGEGREGPRYSIRDMTDERLVLFNL